MKIVINACYGGFSISKEAAQFMAEMGCEKAKKEIDTGGSWYGYGYVDGTTGGYDRTSPFLISAVEQLGDKANGSCARLKIIEIPDGIDYCIEDYDGYESVHENHRSWS